MIQNFGTVSGLTNQPTGLDVGLLTGGSISTQSGSATIAGNTSSATVTISNVDVNKSLIRTTTSPSAATNISGNIVLAKFVSGTTLQFERGAADANSAVTINWEVIEYSSVKTLQTGQTTITSGSSGQLNAKAVTVSTVNPNKCLLVASAKSNASAASTVITQALRWAINSATQITVYAYWQTSSTTTIEWRLIELP